MTNYRGRREGLYDYPTSNKMGVYSVLVIIALIQTAPASNSNNNLPISRPKAAPAPLGLQAQCHQKKNAGVIIESPNNTDCFFLCFTLKEVKMDGRTMTIKDGDFIKVSNPSVTCFTVNPVQGDSNQLSGRLTAPLTYKRRYFSSSEPFALTFAVTYKENKKSATRVWQWTSLTLSNSSKPNHTGYEMTEEKRFAIQKWRVSLDQYLTCSDKLEWSLNENHVLFDFLTISTTFNLSEQRKMSCEVDHTQKLVSGLLSIIFATILFFSILVNGCYKLIAKHRGTNTHLFTSLSTRYQSLGDTGDLSALSDTNAD